jgi:hypothetical protein
MDHHRRRHDPALAAEHGCLTAGGECLPRQSSQGVDPPRDNAPSATLQGDRVEDVLVEVDEGDVAATGRPDRVDVETAAGQAPEPAAAPADDVDVAEVQLGSRAALVRLERAWGLSKPSGGRVRLANDAMAGERDRRRTRAPVGREPRHQFAAPASVSADEPKPALDVESYRPSGPPTDLLDRPGLRSLGEGHRDSPSLFSRARAHGVNSPGFAGGAEEVSDEGDPAATGGEDGGRKKEIVAGRLSPTGADQQPAARAIGAHHVDALVLPGAAVVVVEEDDPSAGGGEGRVRICPAVGSPAASAWRRQAPFTAGPRVDGPDRLSIEVERPCETREGDRAASPRKGGLGRRNSHGQRPQRKRA